MAALALKVMNRLAIVLLLLRRRTARMVSYHVVEVNGMVLRN
jgi:hypothetical protein